MYAEWSPQRVAHGGSAMLRGVTINFVRQVRTLYMYSASVKGAAKLDLI